MHVGYSIEINRSLSKLVPSRRPSSDSSKTSSSSKIGNGGDGVFLLLHSLLSFASWHAVVSTGSRQDAHPAAPTQVAGLLPSAGVNAAGLNSTAGTPSSSGRYSFLQGAVASAGPVHRCF